MWRFHWSKQEKHRGCKNMKKTISLMTLIKWCYLWCLVVCQGRGSLFCMKFYIFNTITTFLNTSLSGASCWRTAWILCRFICFRRWCKAWKAFHMLMYNFNNFFPCYNHCWLSCLIVSILLFSNLVALLSVDLCTYDAFTHQWWKHLISHNDETILCLKKKGGSLLEASSM